MHNISQTTAGDHFLRGVVGQVEEQADIVHRAIFLKVRLEETSRFHVDLKQMP